jgi:hypothetical protein
MEELPAQRIRSARIISTEEVIAISIAQLSRQSELLLRLKVRSIQACICLLGRWIADEWSLALRRFHDGVTTGPVKCPRAWCIRLTPIRD